MYINIKLDKNFVTKYNSLVTEYGDNLAELNGLGNDQLSYTDFIDNFVDKQTVADASIDGNANVGHKDIVSLENEMTKPHSKLLAFNKIYHELYRKTQHHFLYKQDFHIKDILQLEQLLHYLLFQKENILQIEGLSDVN